MIPDHKVLLNPAHGPLKTFQFLSCCVVMMLLPAPPKDAELSNALIHAKKKKKIMRNSETLLAV